jgi:small subunit ribosomal protein S17
MKILQGIVTSLKTEKTATVTVTRKWQHPLYKKFVKRSKKFASHYENLKLELGQTVTIQETKPISKTKRFKVVNNQIEAQVEKQEEKR